jgi:dGTPase
MQLNTEIGAEDRPVTIEDSQQAEVDLLKELTWTYMIERPELKSHQYGQRKVVRELFRTFSQAAADTSEHGLFPEFWRDELDSVAEVEEPNERRTARLRMCADLIASLTEVQAIDWYTRVSGWSTTSVMEQLGLI